MVAIAPVAPLNVKADAEPCFLSMLAEASLEHHHDAKRPRLAPAVPAAPALPGSLTCAEVLEEEAAPVPVAAPVAPRPRSTSPTGKAYLCNQCGRGYANTDAARKHARMQHPEWLKAQGVGCPAFYCTAVETNGAAKEAATASRAAEPKPTALAVPNKPTPLMVATAVVVPSATPALATAVAVKSPAKSPARPALAPITAAADGVPPPAPSPAAAHLLMSAAESCLALSMAAHAQADENHETDDEAEKYESRAERLAALVALGMAHRTAPSPAMPPPAARQASAGNKRPRSVRCGKCDGCERADCGACKNCVDKPKFGGLGKRKQPCVFKVCCEPVRIAP